MSTTADAVRATSATRSATDYFPSCARDVHRRAVGNASWRRARPSSTDEVLPAINAYWEGAELPLAASCRPDGRAADRGRGHRGLRLPGDEPRWLVDSSTMEVHRGEREASARSSASSPASAMKTVDMLGSDEQKERWLAGDGPAGGDRRVRA